MKYRCSVCYKTFGQKCHYDKHLQRKRPCKPDDTQESIEKLQQRVTMLEAALESALANQQGSNITNTTNTNSHNNNTTTNNNIYMCNFGSDNTSFLTHEDLVDISQYRFNRLILRYVEKVNCNKDVPENHNIIVDSLRSGYVQIYENGVWSEAPKKQALERFIASKTRELQELHDGEQGSHLSEYQRKIIRYTVGDDDQEALRDRPREVAQVIYNHRETLKQTKKKTSSRRGNSR